MQVVGILLTILSITLVVAPVGAVVIIYQNDLTQLVIPPQINGLINSEGSSFLVNNTGSGIEGGDSLVSNFITPKFVSADIDNAANTFTVIVDVTNNVNYTFVLDTFSTDIRTTTDNYHLVTVELGNSVTLTPGGTSRVTIVGAWTDEAETHFINHYSGASTINVQLVNTTIQVNGISITLSDPITIDVPLTLEG
jgi:hypothetical protein